MVKRIVTSIITIAVLMGSVVACSGSDNEVAELRAELEELKEEKNQKTTETTEITNSAILSLEEKVYYSDQCSNRNFQCEDWIEKLASEILDSTEEEKQDSI